MKYCRYKGLFFFFFSFCLNKRRERNRARMANKRYRKTNYAVHIQEKKIIDDSVEIILQLLACITAATNFGIYNYCWRIGIWSGLTSRTVIMPCNIWAVI